MAKVNSYVASVVSFLVIGSCFSTKTEQKMKYIQFCYSDDDCGKLCPNGGPGHCTVNYTCDCKLLSKNQLYDISMQESTGVSSSEVPGIEETLTWRCHGDKDCVLFCQGGYHHCDEYGVCLCRPRASQNQLSDISAQESAGESSLMVPETGEESKA